MAHSGIKLYTKFRSKNGSAGLKSEIVELQTESHGIVISHSCFFCKVGKQANHVFQQAMRTASQVKLGA
jgi:hypothetical protein